MIDLSALVPVTTWSCRSCPHTDRTRQAEPHTRMHACPGMGGLTTPMVRDTDDARVVVNVREDYIGAEDVATDGAGRPVMSFTTEHADGRTDVAVLAPTAHISGSC